jgi:hypothetical protein
MLCNLYLIIFSWPHLTCSVSKIVCFLLVAMSWIHSSCFIQYISHILWISSYFFMAGEFHNTQNCWVVELCPSSDILRTRKHNVLETGCFHSQVNWYGPGIYSSFRKLECLKIQLAETLNHITFLMRSKSQGIIPRGFSIKTPFNSRRSSKIAQRASQAFLRNRIHFHLAPFTRGWKHSQFLKSCVYSC